MLTLVQGVKLVTKKYTEPLWWGRGARNCFAVWPNKNGPYHEIYIGNGKTQEKGSTVQLMDHELDSLIGFLQDVRDGNEMENG